MQSCVSSELLRNRGAKGQRPREEKGDIGVSGEQDVDIRVPGDQDIAGGSGRKNRSELKWAEGGGLRRRPDDG